MSSPGRASKRHKICAGKILGIQGVGGTNWMAALLWLEALGLDLRRDNIILQGTGEQVVRAQALESGKVDAAVIDMAFSKKLEQRGFNVIGDALKTDIPFTGVDTSPTAPSSTGPITPLIENMIEPCWKAWPTCRRRKTRGRWFEPDHRIIALKESLWRKKVTRRGPYHVAQALSGHRRHGNVQGC